jgi:phosphatidylglycerophosphate synthase
MGCNHVEIGNSLPHTAGILHMISDEKPQTFAGTVLVRATLGESTGAGRHVAGLTVVERSIKQLSAMNLRIVLASDGKCPLPAALPATVETRRVSSAQDIEPLRTELGNVPEVGADEVRLAGQDLKSAMRVTDENSRKQAEDAVFAQLLRGDLGIVARHLNKPVSFRITRYLLCHLPFTPNQVTVTAALVGLCGAALVTTGRRWPMLLGFFLAHMQSVLDGCDGELARVRFQQSKIGEWLDTYVDEMINTVLFACTGIGIWRATGSQLALAVGLSAAAIHIFYDTVALTELRRQGQGGDLMHIRWWIAGGLNMKNRTGQKRGDLLVIAHGFTRRDFFIFAFLVYALAGVPFLALAHASIIAAGQLVLTISQIGWRLFGRLFGHKNS